MSRQLNQLRRPEGSTGIKILLYYNVGYWGSKSLDLQAQWTMHDQSCILFERNVRRSTATSYIISSNIQHICNCFDIHLNQCSQNPGLHIASPGHSKLNDTASGTIMSIVSTLIASANHGRSPRQNVYIASNTKREQQFRHDNHILYTLFDNPRSEKSVYSLNGITDSGVITGTVSNKSQ